MADFEAPSFSLGLDLDFEPPSFSLGLDLHSEPAPPSHFPPPPLSPDPTVTDFGEDFGPQTLDSDLRVEDSDVDLPSETPPLVLKRLKRGLRSGNSGKRKAVKVSLEVEDEIEEVSSQEDPRTEERPSMQNRSACSTSKLPPQDCSAPTVQFLANLKDKQHAPASNAPAFRSMQSGSNKLMFPKPTVSPLRKIQLLDSDSDEPSISENLYEDTIMTDSSVKGRQCGSSQCKVDNLQKRVQVPLTTHRIEDLWKDFSSKKSVNIQTPALDEFCEEYFQSMEDKNVVQSKEVDIGTSTSRSRHQKNGIGVSTELYQNRSNSHLPSYKYFYHDDPRIRRLVRQRLPHFSPLDDDKNGASNQSDAANIDYMYQFDQRDQTPSNQGRKGSSTRARRSKASNTSEMPEVSGSWVKPKGSSRMPKNAGKRRVSAGGTSAGSWYTGQDGRKVFVTKNGQELTGQIAYRHYKKASGAGFKKSRKKAASKKKASSKKKTKR